MRHFSHPKLHPGIAQKVAPNESQRAQTRRRQKRELTRRCLWRAGSSLDVKRAHNPKVAGSNPAPATIDDEGLGTSIPNPFVLLSVFYVVRLRIATTVGVVGSPAT